MSAQKGAKVGLISRIDYGSRGFRKGLVDAGFELLKREGVHYIILLGGLVSQDLLKPMKDYVASGLKEEKAKQKEETAKAKRDQAKQKKAKGAKAAPRASAPADDLHKNLLKALKLKLQDQFLFRVAEQLAKVIPAVTIQDPDDASKERQVDIFISTSPAFDGDIGETVANHLATLRSDVRVWNAGGDRFPVKFVDKLIWGLAPKKAVWMRSDYYSTAAERVIKDKVKQSSQGSPDLYAVGCFGSSINKPKGELKFAYVSVPVLHRLEDTRVNENQIGVGVLDFPADNSQYLYASYSLKDLVAQELTFVVPPEDATEIQKKAIAVMKTRGWATPGLLKYHLGNVGPERIAQEMKDLMDKKTVRKVGESWPGITYNESSKKYYFDLEWIQTKLKFPLPTSVQAEDRIVTFACVHAGSTETDYQFFVEDVPEIIIKTGATTLVDAGDTKEGMKHSLYVKGEVIAGMNSTKQEKFAAHLIGSVILTVFKARFNSLLKEYGKKEVPPQKLYELINSALLMFIYILGNHDLWETEEGHDPLELFAITMKYFLVDRIGKFLAENGYPCPYDQLLTLVESKVVLKDFFELPSGLNVSVQHPHMARAKTTSLRPQEMLEYAKRHDCQVAIGGNFHVGENVEEWDPDLGQCVCMEVGTIKHGSNFERHKMKMVDQGVGYLRIVSLLPKADDAKTGKDAPKPRIFMTQSAFYGAPRVRPPVDNLEITNAYVKKIGVDPIK